VNYRRYIEFGKFEQPISKTKYIGFNINIMPLVDYITGKAHRRRKLKQK